MIEERDRRQREKVRDKEETYKGKKR